MKLCTFSTNFYSDLFTTAPTISDVKTNSSAVTYTVNRNNAQDGPLITGYEVMHFETPMIGEYVNRGTVTISPAVPGAQYRITAWALGKIGRSAKPAVENATTGEAG